MRSIQRRFAKIQSQDLGLANYTCLMRAVRGQNFKRPALRKAFELLVPKSEFDENERFNLINSLDKLSQTPEDTQKDTRFHL